MRFLHTYTRRNVKRDIYKNCIYLCIYIFVLLETLLIKHHIIKSPVPDVSSLTIQGSKRLWTNSLLVQKRDKNSTLNCRKSWSRVTSLMLKSLYKKYIYGEKRSWRKIVHSREWPILASRPLQCQNVILQTYIVYIILYDSQSFLLLLFNIDCTCKQAYPMFSETNKTIFCVMFSRFSDVNYTACNS